MPAMTTRRGSAGLRAISFFFVFVFMMPTTDAGPAPKAAYLVGLRTMPLEPYYAGHPILLEDKTLRFIRIALDEEAAARLSLDPNVRYIEREASPDLVDLDDPRSGEQWGFARVHAEEARQMVAGSSIDIAYIDSGLASHEDLETVAAGSFNAIDGSKNVTDTCGHGTAIAGVLAATAYNSVGIRGVAPSRLLVYKAFERTPEGQCTGTWGSVAVSLRRAVDDGARVVSLSLGGAVPSAAVRDAITYATAKDVVLVAAAGNHGPCDDCLLFPASDPRVVAVGAWTETEEPARFSAEGPNLRVLAPGVGILTTTLDGGYALKSGTSIATPFVAATLALVRTVNPQLGAHATLDVLSRSTEPETKVLRADFAVAAAMHNIALTNLGVDVEANRVSAHMTIESQTPARAYAGTLRADLYAEGGRFLASVEERMPPQPPGARWIATLVFDAFLTIGTYEVRATITPDASLLEASAVDNAAVAHAPALAPDPSGGNIQALTFSSEAPN